MSVIHVGLSSLKMLNAPDLKYLKILAIAWKRQAWILALRGGVHRFTSWFFLAVLNMIEWRAGCTSWWRLVIQLWRPYVMLCRQGPTFFECRRCLSRHGAPGRRLPARNQFWVACRKHGNCLEFATSFLRRQWRRFVSWCLTMKLAYFNQPTRWTRYA